MSDHKICVCFRSMMTKMMKMMKAKNLKTMAKNLKMMVKFLQTSSIEQKEASKY